MSKFKVSVHRWFTGILASAMVFTALPVNVFGEEVEVIEDDTQVENEGEGEVEENYAVTFDTTGVSSIKYKVGEGEEQTWNSGSEPVRVQKDGSLAITDVIVSAGYNADSVVVKDGETTIEKSGSSWTVGTISAAKTVTVTASLKPGVAVTTLVNGETPSAETATVEVTGLDSENKTKGERLVLSITPAEDKVIKTATYTYGEGETAVSGELEPEGDTYVVPADVVLAATEQQKAIQIAIATDSKECILSFATTGVSEVNYTLNGGTVQTWTPDQAAFTVANGVNLVITGITTSTGYKEDTLTVKVGDTTISKSNNVWTVGTITSATVVNVSADLKPGVTVTALVNGAEPSAETALVEFDGLKDGKTDGDWVMVTINPAKNMFVDYVSCQVGEGTPVKLESIATNIYKIPAETVLTAMDEGQNIKVGILVVNPDEQIYETKLGLNKKTTSFIAGEGVVDWSSIDETKPQTYKDTILLATAKFNSKTTVKKISYAEVIDPDGYSNLNSNPYGGLLIVGDEIRMYRSSSLYVGKYTLKVYAAYPEGRSVKPEPATLTLTVKNPIENIEVTLPSKVYKASGKTATLKATVKYNFGYKDYAPAIKKVTWELLDKDHSPVTSDKVTIKNGTVTIAKDYAVSTTPENNKFYVKAKAADYSGNTAYGETSFEIVGTKTEIKSIAIGSVTDFSGELFSGALLNKQIVVKDSNNNPIDPDDITITSSDSKNFQIGYYYHYDEETGEDIEYKYAVRKIEKAGKFTVTVTVNDGSKSTFKQVIKVKAATPATYKVLAYANYNYGGSAVPIVFVNNVATINEFPTSINVLSEAGSTESSVLVNNANLSVKGGKKLSNGSNTKGKKWINIKPTTDKITITHKYGKGSDAKNETYTINLTHSKIKVGVVGKSYDIWADAEDQDYKFDFNVAGIEDATAGDYCLRFNFPDSKLGKNEKIYRSLINSLNYSDPVSLTKDSSKFTVSGNLYNYNGFPKGTYNLNAALYKATDTDEGPVYTAVSDSFAVTFKASKAKAPSVAIDVTDKKPLEVEKNVDKKALIGFKTYKNAKGIVSGSIKVYCNNKDGSVNRFTEFFNVIPVVKNGDAYEESTGYLADGLQLVVKKTEGINEPKDLTGWVEYTVMGEDNNHTLVKTEKITVKFK